MSVGTARWRRPSRRRTGCRALAIGLVLVAGALLSANAASNTVPASNAGEVVTAAPSFAVPTTAGFSALRSDGGSTAPIATVLVHYAGADAIESVRVYAIRDGVIDVATSVVVVLAELGPAPYDDPLLLDMQQMTAANPTAWSTVESLRVEFYDVDLVLRGVADVIG